MIEVNRRLRQLKFSDDAFLIEVNVKRDQFARHGWHLNKKWKEQSTKNTLNIINNI
jgi:hypothetical protein